MDGKFRDAAEVSMMCVLRRIIKLALKSHSLDSKINSLAVTVYISDGFESFLRSTIYSEMYHFSLQLCLQRLLSLTFYWLLLLFKCK